MASFNKLVLLIVKLVLLIFGLFIATSLSTEQTRFKLTGRIINGFDAKTSQFPYFASLVESSNLKHLCGGAIISRWHILSAAHCFPTFKTKPSAYLAMLGITNLDVITDDVIFSKIEKIVLHPKYRKMWWFNDIAILKTVDEIEFSKNIQPIALSQSNIVAAGGQKTTVCGLGALNHAREKHRIHPKILQYQEETTLSIFECKTKYRKLFFKSRNDWKRVRAMLNRKVFCALKDVGSGPCHGDSGGPLVFNNTIVGVVSASIGCALGYPDLYTNVYEHRKWIKKEMMKTMVIDKSPGNSKNSTEFSDYED